ncbi:hypothetical protein H7X65_00810 [Candidatus Parcubacteria bacterium]|nr:hypothetical protein [Candidatus Parcubacteria bacterium]
MNIENLDDQVRKLTNFELAYGIALALNNKYSSGGYSLGRSERSFLLDFFLRLNHERLSSVSGLDPFVNQKTFLAEGERRLILQISGNENGVSEFQDTKEHFSVVVLYLWITHYGIKMMELRVLEGYKDLPGERLSLNEIDFSFQSEIKSAEAIYSLCQFEAGVPEFIIAGKALKYLHPKSDEDDEAPAKHPYKLELSWHVGDLCEA